MPFLRGNKIQALEFGAWNLMFSLSHCEEAKRGTKRSYSQKLRGRCSFPQRRLLKSLGINLNIRCPGTWRLKFGTSKVITILHHQQERVLFSCL